MTPLMPQHASTLRAPPRRPLDYGRVSITDEQRIGLHKLVLETFTDMVNNGHSLQDTLAAIYLSGMENAVAMSRERGG